MARQFTLKFAACASLFFILTCSATILAQNTSNRNSVRNRKGTTSARKVSPTSMASLERPAVFSPVLITYSRDGAEVDDRKAANVAKRNVGLGESITIYYGSPKSSASNLPKLTPKPKNDPVANSATKTTVPKSPAVNPNANAPAVSTQPPPDTSTTASTSPAESKPVMPNEKSVDPAAVDAKPAVSNEAPASVPTEDTKAVGSPASGSNADPGPAPVSAPPPVSPNAKQTIANESVAKTDPPPTTEAKPATDKVAAPPVTVPAADSKPATETAAEIEPKKIVTAPPLTNPASETKSAPESVTAPPGSTTTADSKTSAIPAESKPTEAATKTTSAPPEAVVLNNTAVQLISESRYAEAADALRRAIQAKPDSYKLHRNLSIVYERMNRTSEALESAQAAVKLAPGEPSALEQLCSTQVQVTKFDEARVVMRT